MSFTYADRRRTGSAAEKKTEIPGRPSLEDLRSGAAKPTAEQMGHRVDLPEAMREKMETAFGADLSAVKLYESEAVAEAGAGAMTQGSDIAFAPGMLDFSSFGGQSLLGHEISHVVSQARGEVSGGGFLNDAALEARADREGAMAAAGQSVALPASSLSPVSAAGASGPMQAGNKVDKYGSRQAAAFDKSVLSEDPKEREKLRAEAEKNRVKKEKAMRRKGMSQEEIDADNRRVTGGMGQMARAHDRFFGQGGQDRAGWMQHLGKIMDSMSDEQLTGGDEAEFRDYLVKTYTDAHAADPSLAKQGAFMERDEEGGDLLGNLYSRMIGRDTIRSALSDQSPGDAVKTIRSRADESGVTALLRKQHDAVFPEGAERYDTNQMNTMRGFWANSILPAASDPEQRPGTISPAMRIDSDLSFTDNPTVRDYAHGNGVPGKGSALSGPEIGDYLLHLSEDPVQPQREPEPEPVQLPPRPWRRQPVRHHGPTLNTRSLTEQTHARPATPEERQRWKDEEMKALLRDGYSPELLPPEQQHLVAELAEEEKRRKAQEAQWEKEQQARMKAWAKQHDREEKEKKKQAKRAAKKKK